MKKITRKEEYTLIDNDTMKECFDEFMSKDIKKGFSISHNEDETQTIVEYSWMG